MDYCYTCRRVLNGALVCPGCGAHAPESTVRSATAQARSAFAPGAHGRPVREAAGADLPGPGGLPDSFWPELASAPENGSGGPRDGLDGADDEPSTLGPASIAPTLHRGRAARRRQQARWRKSRRRAGVATAVALFGGGVAVASWQNGSGRGGNTASSYDTVTPVSLHDGSDGAATGDGTAAAPGTTTAHTASGARHAAPSTTPRTVAPTQATTDGGVTSQLPAGTATTAPSAVGSAGTVHQQTSTGSASTGTAGGTSASTTGSGTDTQTASGGDTASTGGDTTATTAPTAPTSTTPPATSTSPTTPPSQQGLCVLVLCLR
jgi:hypothetical protein